MFLSRIECMYVYAGIFRLYVRRLLLSGRYSAWFILLSCIVGTDENGRTFECRAYLVSRVGGGGGGSGGGSVAVFPCFLYVCVGVFVCTNAIKITLVQLHIFVKHRSKHREQTAKKSWQRERHTSKSANDIYDFQEN